MDDKDYENSQETYYIPQNYSVQGRLLGGLVKIRNAVEAAIIGGAISLLEYVLLSSFLQPEVMLALLAISALPMTILALIGFGDESLTEWCIKVMRFGKTPKRYIYKLPNQYDIARENDEPPAFRSGITEKLSGLSKKVRREEAHSDKD